MASITQTKSGWRVQLYVRGVRDSATLSTKAEAKEWAAARETALRTMVKTGVNTDKTMQDAFDRYAKEVSSHKKTSDAEQVRLIALAAHEIDGRALGKWRLCDVTPEVLGAWRDARLKAVKGSTIVRDMNLLSHVFTMARREWKWIAASPTTDTRRPKESPPRDRRINDAEIKLICAALGYVGGRVASKMQAVAVAFQFAIETGMRAGEICALRESFIVGRTVRLPAEVCKNGTRRDVPLSNKARELLKLLPKNDPVFDLTTSSLDALFRKARDRSGIDNLTFHDTRHEAITRLAQKLNVLELARMVGHRDIKQLQTYFNISAEDMVDRLG